MFISESVLSPSVPLLWGHLHPAPSHPISPCPLLCGAAGQQRGGLSGRCSVQAETWAHRAVPGWALPVSRGLRTTSRCRGRAGGCGGAAAGPRPGRTGGCRSRAAGAGQREPGSRAPLRPAPARWGWPPAHRCSLGARGSPPPRTSGAAALEVPACPVCARCGPAPEHGCGGSPSSTLCLAGTCAPRWAPPSFRPLCSATTRR